MPDRVVQAAQAAASLYDQGKHAEAAAALKAISDSPDFKSYPAGFQAIILVVQARAELRSQNAAAAEQTFKRAIALGQTKSLDDARAGLVLTYYILKKSPGDAAQQVAEIGSEDGVNRLSIRTVWWVVDETDTAALRPLRTAALENLFRLNYGSDEAPGLPDYLWAKLAETRTNSGDAAGARAARDRIVNPEALLEVETQVSTRALWSVEPKSALAAKAIGFAGLREAHAKSNPKSAEAATAAMSAFLLAGQHDAAVEFGKAAMARGSAYSDWADQGGWIANHLSRTYLGKKDTVNAISAMKTGASLTENGEPNVSQTINLMILYNMLGRPRDALAISEPKDGLSDYGRAEFASARVCSHAAAQDMAAADTAYSVLKPMQAKNPSAVFVAALCRNAIPEATAIFLAILNDPKTSDQALASSQTHSLRWTGDYGAEIIARKKQVLSAPEVQAALAKVGRSIETGLWGDFDQF